MPDHSLIPVTALGESTPKIDKFDGLVITENASFALASLTCRLGHDREFSTHFHTQFGFEMPPAGEMKSKGDFTVFSTGLEQWFVEADIIEHENIANELARQFSKSASVTEQDGAWARFDIQGPAAPKVLERLCALDSAKMMGGTAHRTKIEHLGTYVLCRETGLDYSVLGPWSSAHSLHHALVATAKSTL